MFCGIYLTMNILSFIEKSAKAYPDKKAFVYGNTAYSYSEAVAIAKSLATLIPKDIKNSPISVIADRNVDTALYFLAVIYSGNFYVPIDPDAPSEKIQSIIDDCGCKVIFGSSKPENYNGLFFTINDKPNAVCDIPELDESSPLYMVYTSGSTGKPKGVLKSHGAVMSFVQAYTDTFDFSTSDVIGNQTPFFFDASAKDFYLSLKIGATLEIIPTEKFAMPTDLVEYLNERKITFISWVPTALSIVAQLRTFNYILPKYLQKVFFVGEVMPMKYLNVWRKALPDVQFVNLYGQSELAGISCYYEVKGEFADSETLPMGKPLCNCKLYLLEGDTLITEPGKIGEIYVVSDALATEYYNDTEKTAKSFINKDFDDGEVRCFKSGDLASIDEQGNFIFASRSDFQIKHLGHRIELGEIEAIAGALPEIKRCACLYNSEKQAIVLFAEVNDENTTPRDIKHILRQKLSSYMLPEKVKILDSLPINANGKIHRTKLKEML